MRVLFVTNMWPDSVRPWYGSFVHSQARSLRETGVEVQVLPIRGYASAWEYPRAALRALAGNLTAGVDVVHAHYGHSAVVARLNLRRPLVVSYCGDDLLGTPHPTIPSRRTPISRALASAFAQLARFASATITKSKEMEGKLPAGCRGRNHVIPNGVDLHHFAPLDQDEARRRLGWSTREKVALFVGNPTLATKNYPLAREACSRAAADCPELKLRVAWGLTPDEVPTWMSAADVLVCTSWSEGSPNAVKEAMACELPVVSTPVGDVPERLEGVPGCRTVEPDADSVAAAVLGAIAHGRCPDARAAISQLSSERVAERVLSVYESVVRT